MVPNGRKPGAMYVGLMSGTSMDGIDAVLVEFGDRRCEILATQSTPYPDELGAALLQASRSPAECTVDAIGHLDQWIGECFRDASISLLQTNGVSANDVAAIGSHGQTLRHQPHAKRPFTMQIGDPNVIAAGTGITTVGDFRRADVALGGEGAPLTPAFHQWLFASQEHHRVILNIGGIANITILPARSSAVAGFDTGPGNTLLDSMARRNLDQPYDTGGAWAARGSVCDELLQIMLADPYFALPPPKSSGFEYFNPDWLAARISSLGEIAPTAIDLQATLAELTARSIANAILESSPATDEVFICGGGAHNSDLVQRIAIRLAPREINSTAACGLDPDWVEAAAFAWLAGRRLDGKTGNLPAVTGASRAAVLGAVYMCAS